MLPPPHLPSRPSPLATASDSAVVRAGLPLVAGIVLGTHRIAALAATVDGTAQVVLSQLTLGVSAGRGAVLGTQDGRFAQVADVVAADEGLAVLRAVEAVLSLFALLVAAGQSRTVLLAGLPLIAGGVVGADVVATLGAAVQGAGHIVLAEPAVLVAARLTVHGAVGGLVTIPPGANAVAAYAAGAAVLLARGAILAVLGLAHLVAATGLTILLAGEAVLPAIGVTKAVHTAVAATTAATVVGTLLLLFAIGQTAGLVDAQLARTAADLPTDNAPLDANALLLR